MGRVRFGVLGVLAALLVAAPLLLRVDAATATGEAMAPGSRITIVDSGASVQSHVPAPAGRRAQSATFNVTYTGFESNPQAQAAFQHAVDIWSGMITSSVPIVIEATWAPLSGSTLGSAGATRVTWDFSGAPQAGVAYPIALANKIAGRDLSTSYSDIQATFNSGANWYYGTDGNTPSTQSDFVSVVLHEIGHGLGFADSFARTSAGVGSFGLAGKDWVYDRSIVNAAGVALMISPTLGLDLVSGGVYWNGAGGIAAAGGSRPRMYAPTTWSSGSSIAHLDESTYPEGDPNSLMSPQISRGESIHNPGPIALGILSDIGWSTSSVAPAATATRTPTPAATATRTPTRTPTPGGSTGSVGVTPIATLPAAVPTPRTAYGVSVLVPASSSSGAEVVLTPQAGAAHAFSLRVPVPSSAQGALGLHVESEWFMPAEVSLQNIGEDVVWGVISIDAFRADGTAVHQHNPPLQLTVSLASMGGPDAECTSGRVALLHVGSNGVATQLPATLDCTSSPKTITATMSETSHAVVALLEAGQVVPTAVPTAASSPTAVASPTPVATSVPGSARQLFVPLAPRSLPGISGG